VVGEFNNKMIARISGQLYNEIDDYKKTAQLFLDIMNRKINEKKMIKITQK
jgi:hypothetical protein